MVRPNSIDESIEKFLDDVERFDNILDRYDMSRIVEFVSIQHGEVQRLRPALEIEKTRVQLAVVTLNLVRRIFTNIIPLIPQRYLSECLTSDNLSEISEVKESLNKSLSRLTDG